MTSEHDFDEFCLILDSVCNLLSRDAYAPSSTNSALWFRALRKYPINVVRDAFDAHVADPQRGRFVPTPADVIAQIAGMVEDDGRPGAEEAWAMSIAARDEGDTVVWTAEMAQAWNTASTVMALGDETGARMAFRQAYDRLVAKSRLEGVATTWSVSMGHDPGRRNTPVAAAVAAGRLPRSELLALPDSQGRDVLLLASVLPGVPDSARAALRAVADRLRQPPKDGPSAAETEAARLSRLKADSACRVAAYGATEKAA